MTFKMHPLTQLVLSGWLSATMLAASAQTAPEAIRPDMLRPLQAIQELNRDKKAAQALGLFKDIDALINANPLEVFTTERLRAVVYIAAGQPEPAAKALDKALQTERGTVPERLALMENLALIQYQAKAYAEAAQWAGRYLSMGGQRMQFRQLQAQSLYLAGQYKPAAELLQQLLQSDLDAQRRPDEISLRMLADSHQKFHDEAGYVHTLEILVRHYPKPELWADLIARHLRLQALPSSLEIDAYRLQLKVGTPSNLSDAMDHAQLAITAGHPTEALQALERAPITGATPNELARHQTMLAEARRLQQEDERQLAQTETLLAQARDGNAWVNMGFNLVLSGQAVRGITLMRKGLEKGGLRQPAALRLRLGYAELLAEQRQAARGQWKSLAAESGPEAMLARLWLLYLDGPP